MNANTQATSTLSTLIEAASEHLREFGGRVLPTTTTPKNPKFPMLYGGCRSATANIGACVKLFSQSDAYGMGLSATGYAYYPAHDIVVIDRDVKNGKDGRADTDHVAQQIGCPLPETATVATPSGGDHLYFKLPIGTVLPKALIGIIGRRSLDASGNPMLSGVDVFAHSADKSNYVIGPGTKTPTGEYAWANDAPVATLPPAWIDHITAAKPPKPPRDPSQPRPDRETTTLAYVNAVLATLDPANVVQKHHACPHDTRHMIRAIIMDAEVIDAAGYEFPEEDKIELLREWTDRNPRNIPTDFDRKMSLLLENLEDDTIGRAGLGSLQELAKEHGYTGPAPSVALANAKARGLFKVAKPINLAEPPTLSVQAPRDSADAMLEREFTHEGGRTLVRYRNEFHLWDGRRFEPVTLELMNARISDFLAGSCRKDKNGNLTPFNPMSQHVEEVRKALAMQTLVRKGAEAPCWLDGRDGSAPDPKQLLAVRNGLLNLKTRELLPHTPAYFTPVALDFDYDPSASSPEWNTFLGQLWPDDGEQIDTLQEMFGLLLTGDTGHQKAFMIKGPRRSGKGTIGRILTALIGQNNVSAPTLDKLGDTFGKASLIGKRLALVSDAQLGERVDLNKIAETILSITGEDTVNINRKYQEEWVGRLEARFVILANEMLKITNASGALPSRFIFLIMNQTFEGREDHGLEKRLLLELPGILNWSLEGLARLQQRGRFVPPQSSLDALRDMMHLGSPVQAFLAEKCNVGAEFTADCKEIYSAFVGWYKGESTRHPISQSTFGRDLSAAVSNLTNRKVGGRGEQSRRYQGVGLKQPETATQAGDNVWYMHPQPAPAAAPMTPDSATPIVPPAPDRTRAEIRAERLAAHKLAASVQGSGAVH